MIPVNGPSFGRRGGLPRRYPGGTENDSILRTVLRSSPNTREASRVLIPSTRHARRTRAYISTRYIPPPSSQSNPDRRLYAVPFWSATAGSTGRFSGGLLRRRSQDGRGEGSAESPGAYTDPRPEAASPGSRPRWWEPWRGCFPAAGSAPRSTSCMRSAHGKRRWRPVQVGRPRAGAIPRRVTQGRLRRPAPTDRPAESTPGNTNSP